MTSEEIPGWVLCKVLAERQQRREARFGRASIYALAGTLVAIVGIVVATWR